MIDLKMKSGILFFVIMLLLLFSQCEKSGEKGSERWVIAKSGLRLRNTPDLNGKRLSLIPYGSQVRLLDEKGPALVIGDRTGKWSRIVWKKTEGWVFGGFLSRSRPPG